MFTKRYLKSPVKPEVKVTRISPFDNIPILLPKHFIPAIFWFAGSMILLCLPGSTLPRYPWLALIHADKWIHIILFAILGILINLPLRNSGYPAAQRKRWLFWVMAGGILYGASMEFVQKWWIPNRSFEVMDIVSDSIGCLIAYGFALQKGWQKG